MEVKAISIQVVLGPRKRERRLDENKTMLDTNIQF
jgi:hypothetical protein